MQSDILLAALFKYEIGYYAYSHAAHTGFLGDPQVDCSQLVWDGLVGAGYVIPHETAATFSTHTLFNTSKVGINAVTTFTSVADTNFTKLSIDDVKQINGTLQYGDIICFHSKNPTGTDAKGNPTYDQHMGIFYGYDKAGYPMFYGSQSSTGPAVVDMVPRSAWFDGSEIIVGALRPLESMHTGVATGLTAPTSGTGMNIPGLTPDPTATYRKHEGTNGSIMLFYSDGTIFTFAPSIRGATETWSIPNDNGSSTVLTRDIYDTGTPQARFGGWVTQHFGVDGYPTDEPTLGVVNQLAISIDMSSKEIGSGLAFNREIGSGLAFCLASHLCDTVHLCRGHCESNLPERSTTLPHAATGGKIFTWMTSIANSSSKCSAK